MLFFCAILTKIYFFEDLLTCIFCTFFTEKRENKLLFYEDLSFIVSGRTKSVQMMCARWRSYRSNFAK